MEISKEYTRRMRNSYSVSGWSFTLLLILAVVAQLVMTFLPRVLWGEADPVSDSSWWMWLSSFLPMYLFAFPACFLLMKVLPAQAPQKRNLTRRQFLLLLPICACLMQSGNLVGTILSLLLSRGQANNAIMDYAMDNSPLKILVMVILAPTLEELICRKLLIDRTVRYGEKLSVLMSGLIFGLLHQNLYQFFYAFALGSLFAYVYVRTGRIKYPIILHMIINFLGAVVVPLILSTINTEAFEPAAQGTLTMELMLEVLPGCLLLLTYFFSLTGVAIWGLVLLILNCRRLTWKEEGLSFRQGLNPAFLNAGMIVYSALCLAMMVLALFNG